MADAHYTQLIHTAEEQLLRFLRTFESIQEHIRFDKIGDSQAELQAVTGDMFSALADELAALSPSDALTEFHAGFTAALAQCAGAAKAFLEPGGKDFSLAFLQSRWALCKGMNLLYDLRAHTPTLQEYWLLPEYVPENYDPNTAWPLIICLHGGYGRGEDYIWAWLRPAKSKGYLLLSPKSVDVTWSVLQPPLDVESITRMFDEVCATYAVDTSRVYLSGLSDGGTFTYMLGLSRPDMFTGIAPIAGDFHAMLDPMLRRKQGQGLPLYIVHGVHDFIFPVATIRQGYELLSNIGYNATYEELPDWGHAYTSRINEELVLPWFEGLEPRQR